MRVFALVGALVACVHAGLWALSREQTTAPNFRGQLASVSYTPFDGSADPRNGAPSTAKQIRDDLRALAPYTRTIRTYSVEKMRDTLRAHPVQDEDGLRRVLRHLRKSAMLRLIVRDLTGLADLSEVTTTASALAEESVRFALEHLQRWMEDAHGIPQSPAGARIPFLVLGMGKLGGNELNVSSDIDLIFVYPEDGDTDGARSVLENFGAGRSPARPTLRIVGGSDSA